MSRDFEESILYSIVIIAIIAIIGLLTCLGVSLTYCSIPKNWKNENSICYNTSKIKEYQCNKDPNLAYCRSLLTEKVSNEK